MKRLSKNQKELIMLGAILAAIVAVLAVYVFKPPMPIAETFTPKTLDTRIPTELLDRPAYRRLGLPIELPLLPGRTGRPNPFDPY